MVVKEQKVWCCNELQKQKAVIVIAIKVFKQMSLHLWEKYGNFCKILMIYLSHKSDCCEK